MQSVFTLPNISLPYGLPADEAVLSAIKAAGRCRPASAEIIRKATDARKKNDIRFVYTVKLTWDGNLSVSDESWLTRRGFRKAEQTDDGVFPGSEKLDDCRGVCGHRETCGMPSVGGHCVQFRVAVDDGLAVVRVRQTRVWLVSGLLCVCGVSAFTYICIADVHHAQRAFFLSVHGLGTLCS